MSGEVEISLRKDPRIRLRHAAFAKSSGEPRAYGATGIADD